MSPCRARGHGFDVREILVLVHNGFVTDIQTPYDDAIDLRPRAGIPVFLHPDSLSLHFGPEVPAMEAEKREAGELRPVLLQPEAAAPDELLYSVYRGIIPSPAAGEELVQRGLIYVALALRPGTIGPELSRTRGHINSPAPGTPVAYPEVHEIWHGHGLLYLQCGATRDAAQETVVVPMSPGDKAVVAPGWASLLVNVDTEPLVVGTWRSIDCILQHDALALLGGMAHYIQAGDRPGAYTFTPNPHYGEAIGAPRLAEMQDIKDFGLLKEEPMLTSFRRNPDYLRFMQRPQDFADVWPALYENAPAGA